MANWELLQYRMDGCKVIRRAQCPYCDYTVEYMDSEYPPVNCPDCARELEFVRPCPYAEGDLVHKTMCNHRGSCYFCDVFQNANWRKGEDY